MKKKILLVEYSSATVESIKQLLHHKGIEIMVAGSEEVAKKLLACHSFQMVITESLLPKSHGFILSKYIAGNFPQTRVIILSEQLQDAENKTEAVSKYGASDLFEKPLDEKTFKERVFSLLEIGSEDDYMGDTDNMTTNLHILPSLEQLAVEKSKLSKKNDSFGRIIEDIKKSPSYEIELE